MVKIIQNCQNGLKLSRMIQNGQKWSKWSKMVQMVKNGGPDLKRARRTGPSARRARGTKSRGPKGLQLEVGARRAPRLLVFNIWAAHRPALLYHHLLDPTFLTPSGQKWLRTVFGRGVFWDLPVTCGGYPKKKIDLKVGDAPIFVSFHNLLFNPCFCFVQIWTKTLALVYKVRS